MILSSTDVWWPVWNSNERAVEVDISLSAIQLVQPSGGFRIELFSDNQATKQVSGQYAMGWGRPAVGVRSDVWNADVGPPPDAWYSIFYELPDAFSRQMAIHPGWNYLLIALESAEAEASIEEVNVDLSTALDWGEPVFDPLLHRALWTNNGQDWDSVTEVYTAWGGVVEAHDEEIIRYERNYLWMMTPVDAKGVLEIQDSAGNYCRDISEVAHFVYLGHAAPGPVQLDARIAAPPKPVWPGLAFVWIMDVPLDADDSLGECIHPEFL